MGSAENEPASFTQSVAPTRVDSDWPEPGTCGRAHVGHFDPGSLPEFGNHLPTRPWIRSVKGPEAPMSGRRKVRSPITWPATIVRVDAFRCRTTLCDQQLRGGCRLWQGTHRPLE
jgi:hypothetical protein